MSKGGDTLRLER